MIFDSIRKLSNAIGSRITNAIDSHRRQSMAIAKSFAIGSIRLLSILFALSASAAIETTPNWAESEPPIRFKSRDWADAVLAAASTNSSIAIEGGRLLSNATWSSERTHLVFNTVYVPSGVTLTISEGAVVKFCPGTIIKVEDGGKLNIVGASGNEVILTAANDATVGEAIAGLGDEAIAFDGIRLQSSAATFTDNGWLETRGFNYGAFPTVSVLGTEAVRNGGVAYVPFTLSGSSRETAFSVEWEAVQGTAKFGDDYTLASGTISWGKSSEGTKTLQIPLNAENITGEERTFTVRIKAARCSNIGTRTATVKIVERDALTLEWAGDWSESEPPIRFKSRDWADAVLAAASTNDAIAIEGGRLLTNTTWDATKTHLVFNTVYVPSGITLTIFEGAVVKFCPGTMIKVEDGGKLSIVGASGNDVILTAANDATAGEAIAGLGEESFAFGGIRLQSSAATFTDNGWLETRGFNYGAYPSVKLNDSTAFRSSGLASIPVTISGTRDQTLTIDWVAEDVTAKYGEDYTLASGRITWGKASEGTKTITIPLVASHIVGETTTFKIKIVTARGVNVADGECTVSIREFDTLNIESASAESEPPIRFKSRDWADAVLAAASTNDAIIVEGGRLLANTTWDATKTHLVFNTVYVPSGVTLTISAGAVVKFCPGTMIKVEDGGKLSIIGASGNDVILTAANDATVGEIVEGLGEEAITFGGIRLQSSASTFTDNGWLETRGFNYGAYPSVTLHDATANRKAGMVYLPVTVGGTTRNQSFTVDWIAEDGSAQFGRDYMTQNSGRLTWSKSGDGTKYITIPLVTTEKAGSNRTFTVRFVVARGVNVTDGEATVTIAEFENGGITSMEVVEHTPSEASPEFTVDEGIGIQPIFLKDVEKVQYSGKWQTYDKNEAAALRVTVESDNGVKILKETAVTETGTVDLKLADYPVGCYTLKHEILNALGETLATMSKTFSVADEEDVELHGGTLTQNEIWSADKVHVVYQTVYVPSIYTLFIEPGAIVKFMTGTGIDISQGGALFANKIVFTHINDDTIGGDTLSDGYTVAPPMDAYTLSGNFTFGDDTELRGITQNNALTGTISTRKVLSRGSTYRVSGTLTIANGGSLTIPPGTVLKMESGASIVVNSGATLTAVGTRAAPIIITSIKDDSVSGDTNGDGDKTIPQPGDWVKIGINGGTANFEFTSILYSSKNQTTGAINMNGGTVVFNNSEIAHGMYDAVGVESGHYYMTNSVIRDCLLAFRHWAKDPIVNSVIYDCGRLTQGGGQHFVNCIFSRITETWEAFGFPQNGTTYDNCCFWNEEGSVLTAEGKQDAMTVCGKNGNIWGDPLFVDPDNGDFRIEEGSPCVDAADSSVAPEYDYYGQPRITVTDQGTNTVGQLADIGICEVMPRNVTSDIDLVPQNVRTVTNAVPGELLFIKWEVKNVGGGELKGAWRDTVSLVSNNGREVVLGNKTTTGVIAPGGSIFCSGYFTVPPISEGEWYPKVNVNSYRDVFEGALGVNNALVGERALTVKAEALDPSVAREGVIGGGTPSVIKLTFGADDENRMVKFDVPAGVKVTWGFGFMPQGASQSGSMTATDGGVMFRVPEGATDVYVVLESDKTATYEMTTESTKMVITGVTPNTLPSSGTTTLTITGAGFGETNAVILATATDIVRLQSIAKDASGNLIATVDCSTLTAGVTYGVRVESGEKAAELDSAVTVTKAEGKGELEANLIIPSQVRIGRVNTGYVQYSNIGSANMLAPIFRIDSQEIDTLVSLDNSGVFSDTSVRLVGIGAANPNGVLMPGDVMRLPFYFIVKGRGAYNFKLSILNTDSKDFRDSVFETWGEFALEISNAATCLNGNGKMVCDYDKIYQLAMRKGYGDSTGMVCGQLIDVNSGVVMAKDRLVLCETNGTKIAISETDDNGRFNFDGLKVGELYSIESQTSQFREYIIANNGIGDVYYAAPLASVAVNIEGVETDDISAVLLNDGDRVHQMKLSESDSTYIIKDLVDGVYSLNIEIEGYQCVTSDVSYIIYAGCVTNTPEKIVAVPSGHAVISLIDETSTPIVGEACVLRNVVTGFEFQSFTKENGKAYFNCPSGKYALEAGNGLSVDQEVTIEIVNGEDVVLSVVAKKVPFALYPPMGAVPLTVVGELAFTNSLKSIAQCQWDFNGDGIWDVKGLVATNIYNNASSYNVAVKLLFSDGDEQVFSQNAAVETWNEDKIEYVDDALVLDTMSGYRIVEKEGARIVLSITGEMPPKALFEGMVIVDPNDKLQPYEIISFDAIDNQTLVLDVKVVTLEKAYRTFQVSSLRSPLLYSSGDSGFNLDNYDGRAKINLEPKLSLDALKEYGLEGALQGNIDLDIAICIQAKKLKSLSVSTGWHYMFEAKSKLDGASLDLSKKYRKWKRTTFFIEEPIRMADKQMLVGYIPVRIVGKYCLKGELEGKIKVLASSRTVRKYTKSRGWEKIAPNPSCDITFEGKVGFSCGFNVECGIGVGRTAAGKDYGFNLGDVKAEIGAKAESKIEYHFDEFTSDKFSCWAGPYFKLTGKICHLKLGSWGDLSLMDISPLEFNWKLFNWEWQTPMPDFSCEFPNGMICVNSVDVNFLSTTEAGESKFVERSWDLGGVDGGSGSTARRSFPCKPKDKTYYTIYLREKYQPPEILASWLPTATKATKKEIWVKGDDSDDDDGDYDDGGGLGGVVLESNDPNEMAGPLGLGDPNTERFVKPGEWMTYTVYFENMTNATAAAQEVYVTNPLSEWLDWSTFEMSEVSFGNQIDLGLSGKSSGTTEKRMDGTNWIVRTELSIEPDTTALNSNRQPTMCAKWYLRIVDPSTNTGWPIDPVAGFLPPNNPETHCGEGHLTYRIKLRDDAPSGLVITNSATIVFDYNEPITTDPAWWNTVAPTEGMARFSEADILAEEGTNVTFSVFGGNAYNASSVKLYLTYNTAAAADVDLKASTVADSNRQQSTVSDSGVIKNLKFPLTLTWAAGEIGEKTITIPVKTDKAVEDAEQFTLQLADPVGMELGEARLCTVTITDPGHAELEAKIAAGTATKAEQTAWDKLQKAKAPYIRGVADPANAGKVTGSGLCASGKKVTLKAAANKGYVFTGWLKSQIALDGDRLVTNAVEYVATTPSLVIDRTAKPAKDTAMSTTLTNVNDNATFYAAFITTDEDKAAVGLTLNGGEVPQVEDNAPSLVTNIMCGVALNWPLASSALSQTTVKVAGLPAGLKFTAKDIMKKGSKTEVEIPANTIYGAPTAASKIDKKTGLSVPSAVKVTVTTAGKSSVTYLMNITVDALPAWAVGNFEGFVRYDENDGGFATMSITAAGKISGKISYGGTNWTFKADSFAIASETVGYTNLALRTVATSGKATLNFSLNMVDFLVDSLPSSTTSFAEGYFGEVYIMMYRLPWKDKGDADVASLIASYAGAYSCSVPYGDDSGDVTFVLDEKGAVKGTVVLPDGDKTRKATFSSNALTGDNSLSVVIALPPDAKKGYPAVFKVVNLVNHSGEGADNLAFRDPGVVAAVAELTAESGATGTVSVNPKYGQVAPGKDVTLTAKAAKGSVFHRWEITGVDTEGLDLSSATLKFKMTDAGDVFATALFATTQEDAASLALDLADAITETDGAFSLDLGACVSSLSLAKLTVAGLPTGLKYDAKTMTISGKATKPGLYTVKVTATNASATGKKVVVGQFTIEVPNFTAANGYFVDGLYNDIGEKYTLSVGIANIDEFLPSLALNSGTTKLAVSGLPSGLKYDAKTGKITGIATRPGTYTVTLTVTDGKAKCVSTITVEVEPLPEILIGTYTGLIGRDVNVGNDDPWMAYGMASVTVAANGKISAKMTLPCGTYSFSAAGWVSAEDGVYSAVIRTKKGDEFELVIDSKRNWKEVAEDSALLIDGYKEFRVPLWRNEHVKGGNIESDPIAKELISEIKALKKVAFKVEGSKSSGYEVTELASNDRSANLIVTFDTKGGVKYAGNFDGVRVSGSTFLCIDDDGYYTICDIVVLVGKTESVYISFGVERDEDGELQFEVDVIRSEFQE